MEARGGKQRGRRSNKREGEGSQKGGKTETRAGRDESTGRRIAVTTRTVPIQGYSKASKAFATTIDRKVNSPQQPCVDCCFPRKTPNLTRSRLLFHTASMVVEEATAVTRVFS